MSQPVYLDNAATTPLDPRVLEAMLPFFGATSGFGNPSSQHEYGRHAQQAIDQAQTVVKELFSLIHGQVIWTSGATEANNLAILGAARFYQKRRRHIITTAQEHPSILKPCEQLEKEQFRITKLAPKTDGRICLNELANACAEDTLMITLAHANSETGVIQDIAGITDIAQQKGVMVHLDAAQTAGKYDLSAERLQYDLLSLSAHKHYGPKGVGALLINHRPKRHLMPIMFGGGQQQSYRPGTLPTALIVGLGAALTWVSDAAELQRIASLRDELVETLRAFPVCLNGSFSHRLANNVNFSIKGIHGDALRYGLSDLAVSQGSACQAASHQPSYVLQSMGLSMAQARDSIRMTLGRFTTPDDILRAKASLTKAIEFLSELSPC